MNEGLNKQYGKLSSLYVVARMIELCSLHVVIRTERCENAKLVVREVCEKKIKSDRINFEIFTGFTLFMKEQDS